MKYTALIIAACFTAALAHCPNACSGHGKCTANDICQCHQNWQGADCSLRTCPYEFAWVDTAVREDDAHYYAECANKGVCDRKTGICKCFDGYEGKGCQRSTCPDDCSGHGTCEYINELANDSEDRRVKGVDGLVYSETQWDWQKIRGCKCDLGFEGPNCASRVCAAGDDPLTSINKYVHEKQRLSIGVPSASKLFGATAVTGSTSGTTTLGGTTITMADISADPAYADWEILAKDLIHIGTSKKLYTVISATPVTGPPAAIKVVVDQAFDAGAVGASTPLYRVKSEIAETTNTNAAAATVTNKLTLSGLNALIVPGVVLQVEDSPLTYVVDAVSVSGLDLTLDQTVQIEAVHGSAKVYSKVFERPQDNDQWFVTYYDAYGGMWNTTTQTVTSSVTDDAEALQTALRALPNHVLDDVVVSGYQDVSGGSTTAGFHEDGSSKAHIKNVYEFIVTFQGTVGTSGSQNLFEIEGRPTDPASFPKSDGLFHAVNKPGNKHGTSLTRVTKEGVSGKTSMDRSELAACSNRGLCDGTTGLCKCFQGFRGLACEFQEALV